MASLCRGLVTEGHEVTVAYSPYRLDEAFERFMSECEYAVRFRSLGMRREVSPLSDLRVLARLARLVNQEGPFDVVHGHSSKGGALARLSGRLSNLPTVYTPHSLIMSSPEVSRRKAAFYGAVEQSLGRLATSKMIAVSEEERKFILELGMTSKERVSFIPNGIEDRDFAGLRGLRAPCPQEPFTFGSTMRFSTQKAPERLIKAFMQTSRDLPHLPLRLVIAGEGELYEGIRDWVVAEGWAGSILLPGWSGEAADVLGMMDVFVVSSLYEAGLSFSTMEAMAAGLPVVSTEVFGVRGTLMGIPGNVVVPVGDTAELARGLKRMATVAEPPHSRDSLRCIGEANRDYVREHFVQSEVTRRTVEIYRDLCQRFPARAQREETNRAPLRA